MTDEPSFLTAMRAAPDERDLRGVYADWLDERAGPGDAARAEFVRIQCRIAGVRETCGCGACAQRRRPGGRHHNGSCGLDQRQDDGVRLRCREHELLAANEKAWRAGPKCGACGGAKWQSFPDGHGDCRGCWGSGDAGGLTRTFPYEYDGGHVGLYDHREPVRIDWSRYPLLALIVPRLADCVTNVPGLHQVAPPALRGPARNITVSVPTPSAWLAAVVKHHPVISVVPLDREPVQSTTGWWWASPRSSVTYPLAVLPEVLFRLLANPTVVITCFYPSRDEALFALGAAVVQFAKEAAT